MLEEADLLLCIFTDSFLISCMLWVNAVGGCCCDVNIFSFYSRSFQMTWTAIRLCPEYLFLLVVGKMTCNRFRLLSRKLLWQTAIFSRFWTGLSLKHHKLFENGQTETTVKGHNSHFDTKTLKIMYKYIVLTDNSFAWAHMCFRCQLGN